MRLLIKVLWICAIVHLIPINVHAQGYFEARKYFKTNRSGYTDYTGEKAVYGLDTEFYIPIVPKFINIMLGADAIANEHYFTQAAGRLGVYANVPYLPVEIRLYHRSNHNFDHLSIYGPRFINDNWVAIRYNFHK